MSNIEAVKLFNDHQASSKQQTEFLAKSVLLIAGGELSVSITAFLGKDAPSISPELKGALMLSWYGLFSTVFALVIVFLTTIYRDYHIGERWRLQLHGQKIDVKTAPRWPDRVMWVSGVLGLMLFLAGTAGLAHVASQILLAAR